MRDLEGSEDNTFLIFYFIANISAGSPFISEVFWFCLERRVSLKKWNRKSCKVLKEEGKKNKYQAGSAANTVQAALTSSYSVAP